jgi:signal peptidase I
METPDNKLGGVEEKKAVPAEVPEEDTITEEDKSALRGWFKSALEFAGELLHVVILSLAVIIPIRYFLVQPFYVKGASMEPNLYDHEYLIINEISYRLNEPQRGDIVVFRYPNDPRQFFIKRIVGLPGEKITVSGGKVVVCQGEDCDELDETAYIGDTRTSGDREAELGGDEYFLMGDNRGSSLDSRSFGPVPRDFLIGKVLLRGWPPEKFKYFGSNQITAEAVD